MAQEPFISLDLPRLRDHWRELGSHRYGARYIDTLAPQPPLSELHERLDWSAALEAFLGRGEDLPTPRLDDIDPLVALSRRPGAVLGAKDLLSIRTVLEALGAYARALRHEPEGGPLHGAAEVLAPPRDLLGRLLEAIDPDGELRDQASPSLTVIRRRLRTLRDELQHYLQRLLRQGDLADAWQEALVTLRGDRYVLPVKASHKGRVRGIVHDRSASGETLFIEPLGAVDLNNRLVEARREESLEVARVLAELTALVGMAAEPVLRATALMGRLDGIRAGLLLGHRYQWRLPEVSAAPAFALRQLRHPLLCLQHGPDHVVANDVALGEEACQLLVSGPNTGGKTALLKAVGLVHLMAYLGLPIPAEGRCGYFPHIGVVIGDAQDIAADLSTFSSYLTRLREILAEAGTGSLVLLDELGSGTDPREGGALGVAIAEALLERRANAVITSHLEALKHHAVGRPGVQVASMAFDETDLRPLYQLRQGVGGGSHALDIARRLGLPAGVLGRAREWLDVQETEVDRLLRDRERLLQEALDARDAALMAREEADALRAQLRRDAAAAEDDRARAYEEAQRRWQQTLEAARAQVREAIAALKGGRDTQAASRALDAADRMFQPNPAPPKVAPAQPQVGEVGLFLPYRLPAQVLAVDIPQGRVQVLARGKVLWGRLDQFRRDPGVQLPEAPGRLIYPSADKVPMCLDLRGHRREEAEAMLCRYVDEVVAAGRQQAQILHGKGDGVLAEMVRDFARTDPRVRRWSMARPEQGGAGVTDLELG